MSGERRTGQPIRQNDEKSADLSAQHTPHAPSVPHMPQTPNTPYTPDAPQSFSEARVERVDSDAQRLLNTISASMRATVGILTQSDVAVEADYATLDDQEFYIGRGSVDMKPLRDHVSQIYGGFVLQFKVDNVGPGFRPERLFRHMPIPTVPVNHFRSFYREQFEGKRVDERRDFTDAYSVCLAALQRMYAARSVSLAEINSAYDSLAFARRESYWGRDPGPENIWHFLLQLSSLSEKVADGGVIVDRKLLSQAIRASHFLAVEADVLGSVA